MRIALASAVLAGAIAACVSGPASAQYGMQHQGHPGMHNPSHGGGMQYRRGYGHRWGNGQRWGYGRWNGGRWAGNWRGYGPRWGYGQAWGGYAVQPYAQPAYAAPAYVQPAYVAQPYVEQTYVTQTYVAQPQAIVIPVPYPYYVAQPSYGYGMSFGGSRCGGCY